MAYAAAASLSHTIDLALTYHQHLLSPQVKDQIISLHTHINFLQSFLEDFPDRANNWEETIREVTDRAEDIIELLLSDSLLKSTVESSKSEHEFHGGFDKLERVTEEIESIANRVKGRPTETETMDGFEPELMKILCLLGEGPPALTKIAIVGMGGTGKTTLAKNAFNHPLIVEHFFFRAWSTVTTDYSLRGIISDLSRSMNNKSLYSSKSVESLFRSLYGRRYLIVLDDIWSREAWKELKTSLPDNGNGSRIILTTRFADVARTANYVHKMRLLDEDRTWNLLRQKIFKGDPCPSQLESVGKMIARNCRDHRLSIDVVSVILGDDQTRSAWEDILENIMILTSENEFESLHLLSISYLYLPHHLRPCFLYLGIFPEKEEIHVSKLVKLWAAEGFLNQSGSKSFEETGEECVAHLVRRSLVSVSERKSTGRIKSITVHDLMRELIQGQAREDNFFRRFNQLGRLNREAEASILHMCRRVSNLPFDEDILEGVYGSTIRTMLYGDADLLGLRCSVENVRLLRILDFLHDDRRHFTLEVYELFHLRYLAFDSSFTFLGTMSNLQNLQTLIISSNKDGIILPGGIWWLPQLRHLLMSCCRLPSQLRGTPPLENLQTLSRVADFVCSRLERDPSNDPKPEKTEYLL